MNIKRNLKIGVLLLSLLGALPAHAAQSLTIQGKVVDSGGQPVNGLATQFRVQILTPSANRCVLFDETHTVDLSQSNGLFSINLNNGLGTVNLPNTYSLEQAVSNGAGFLVNSTYCASGSGTLTYSPNPTDSRKVIIQFRDPATMAAFETIPEMDLNPVAYAMESRAIGGYSPSSIFRVANGGIPGAAPSFTSSQVTELQSLVGGTSTNYMTTTTGSTTGARLPTVSGDPSTPSAGSIWFDTTGSGALKYYDSSGSIRTVGTGTGSGTITGVTAGTGLLGGGSTGSVTLSLGTSGVTAASYGSASAVPVLTVDAYGRISSATTTAITGTLPSGTAGQFLRSDGTAWTSQKILLGDLKSTVGGADLFSSPGCTAAQALYWDSGTDQVKCQSIAINASAITAGTIADARLADVGTAGTYRSVTTDAKGRITAGTNPTTLSGYAITDAVQNAAGVPSIAAGLDAAIVSAGTAGRLYIATDSFKIYRDNGTTWDTIASAEGSGGDITAVSAGAGLAGGGTSGAVSLSMPNVGTVGTYPKVTTDAQGRVTAGASLAATDIPNLDWAKIVSGTPTSLLGYGITDGIKNAGSAVSIQAGLAASRPAQGAAGRFYVSTNTNVISYDDGTTWIDIVSGTGFSGSLSGDVTGTQGSTVVANVGGSTAANVNAGVVLANAATNVNTAGAIVKRDASGNFAAGAISQGSSIFRDGTTNTIGLAAPTSVTSYNLTLPAAAPGSNGQTLSSTTAGVLSWVTPTAATSVAVTAPITNSGTATAPNIGIPAASGSVDGYLSSASFTAFTNKLSNALTSAMIFVGNGTNVATGVAVTGDVAITNAGVTTVNAVKGITVTAAPTLAGQVLRFDGTNLVPNFTSMGDLRSTVTGSSALTIGCTAGQTLTWNSGTDNLQCQSISVAAATQITGILPIANGGTGANSTSQNFVFAGPTSGAGAPAFRALAAGDLPSSASAWTVSGSDVYRSSGNVGIGTITPSAGLDIATSGTSGSAVIVPRDTTANRPSTPVNGMIRYNTSSSKVEAYQGGAWVDMIASGGSSQWTTTGSDIFYTSGKVGIGTSSPVEFLDMRLDQDSTTRVRVKNSNSGTSAVAGFYAANNANTLRLEMSGVGNGDKASLVTTGTGGFDYNVSNASGVHAFKANGTTIMTLNNNGRVGIGTTNPQATLDVNGYVRLTPQGVQPVACSSTNNGALALTSQFTICACKGASAAWVRTTDGSTACTW